MHLAMEPHIAYRILPVRDQSTRPFVDVLLSRPWFVKQGDGDDNARKAVRANKWHVLISDGIDLDLGFGAETLFSLMGDAVPSSGPATAYLSSYQVVNHFPNSSVLTSKANLIKALHRQYAGTPGAHVFDVVPTCYYLPGGVRSEAESPTLRQFFKRHAALAHAGGDSAAGAAEAASLRLPRSQCERNLWIIKPVACGGAASAVIFSRAEDIKTFLRNARGDYVIQKYIERPLLAHGRKVTLRFWVLVTDAEDVYVYRTAYATLAAAPYSPAVVSQGTTPSAAAQAVHVTSQCVTRSAHQAGSAPQQCPGGIMYLEELQAHIDATWPGALPHSALSAVIVPRCRRIIVDAVRGAFAAPLPLSATFADPRPVGSRIPGSGSESAAAAAGTSVSQHPRAGAKGRRCFELFGVDFAVAEDGRPFLLSFSQDPDLSSPSPDHPHASVVAGLMAAMAAVAIDPLFPSPPVDDPRTAITSHTLPTGSTALRAQMQSQAASSHISQSARSSVDSFSFLVSPLSSASSFSTSGFGLSRSDASADFELLHRSQAADDVETTAHTAAALAVAQAATQRGVKGPLASGDPDLAQTLPPRSRDFSGIPPSLFGASSLPRSAAAESTLFSTAVEPVSSLAYATSSSATPAAQKPKLSWFDSPQRRDANNNGAQANGHRQDDDVNKDTLLFPGQALVSRRGSAPSPVQALLAEAANGSASAAANKRVQTPAGRLNVAVQPTPAPRRQPHAPVERKRVVHDWWEPKGASAAAVAAGLAPDQPAPLDVIRAFATSRVDSGQHVSRPGSRPFSSNTSSTGQQRSRSTSPSRRKQNQHQFHQHRAFEANAGDSLYSSSAKKASTASATPHFMTDTDAWRSHLEETAGAALAHRAGLTSPTHPPGRPVHRDDAGSVASFSNARSPPRRRIGSPSGLRRGSEQPISAIYSSQPRLQPSAAELVRQAAMAPSSPASSSAAALLSPGTRITDPPRAGGSGGKGQRKDHLSPLLQLLAPLFIGADGTPLTGRATISPVSSLSVSPPPPPGGAASTTDRDGPSGDETVRYLAAQAEALEPALEGRSQNAQRNGTVLPSDAARHPSKTAASSNGTRAAPMQAVFFHDASAAAAAHEAAVMGVPPRAETPPRQQEPENPFAAFSSLAQTSSPAKGKRSAAAGTTADAHSTTTHEKISLVPYNDIAPGNGNTRGSRHEIRSPQAQPLTSASRVVALAPANAAAPGVFFNAPAAKQPSPDNIITQTLARRREAPLSALHARQQHHARVRVREISEIVPLVSGADPSPHSPSTGPGPLFAHAQPTHQPQGGQTPPVTARGLLRAAVAADAALQLQWRPADSPHDRPYESGGQAFEPFGEVPAFGAAVARVNGGVNGAVKAATGKNANGNTSGRGSPVSPSGTSFAYLYDSHATPLSPAGQHTNTPDLLQRQQQQQQQAAAAAAAAAAMTGPYFEAFAAAEARAEERARLVAASSQLLRSYKAARRGVGPPAKAGLAVPASGAGPALQANAAQAARLVAASTALVQESRQLRAPGGADTLQQQAQLREQERERPPPSASLTIKPISPVPAAKITFRSDRRALMAMVAASGAGQGLCGTGGLDDVPMADAQALGPTGEPTAPSASQTQAELDRFGLSPTFASATTWISVPAPDTRGADCYYYHPVTRAVRWDDPTASDPTAIVIPQAQVDALAKAAAGPETAIHSTSASGAYKAQQYQESAKRSALPGSGVTLD